MTTVIRRGSVPAPIDQVWATLADFGALASWAPAVDHSCLLTSDVDPSAMARRVQVGATTLVEEVVGWEPPRFLAYRLRGLPALAGRVRTEWALTADGPATTVTVTTTIDAGRRPPARLAARLVGRRLATVADEMLDGLAAHHAHAKGSIHA